MEGDRHAYRVRLPAAGRALFGEMARQHEIWIVAAFDSLSPAEAQTLHQLLGKVKQHHHRDTLPESD